MNQSGIDTNTTPAVGSSKTDRLVKTIFVLAALGILVYLGVSQFRGVGLPDWPRDLNEAIEQSKVQNRPILVFFAGRPPSQTDRRLAQTTIAKNAQAIADGKFLTVLVQLDPRVRSDLAGKYAIKTLPAVLILSAEGLEINRREGFVGEVEFRAGFLDLSDVRPGPR